MFPDVCSTESKIAKPFTRKEKKNTLILIFENWRTLMDWENITNSAAINFYKMTAFEN